MTEGGLTPAQLNQLLGRMQSEFAKLRQRIEMEARQSDLLRRRYQELAPEETGVAEVRDAIPRLNGGGPAGAAPAPGTARPWKRAGRVSAAWWPREAMPDQPLTPSPGWQNYSLHGDVTKVIGVSVCGLPRDVIAMVIQSVIQQQAMLRDFAPVFLTDSTEFDLFRRHGFAFEYLPDESKRARFAGTPSWRDYMSERRAFLVRKWGMARIIAFGPVEFGSDEPIGEEVRQIAGEGTQALAAPKPDKAGGSGSMATRAIGRSRGG